MCHIEHKYCLDVYVAQENISAFQAVLSNSIINNRIDTAMF